MARPLLLALLVLASCAAPFDPPVAGDRAAPRFAADLARCRKQAGATATRKANATPQSAVRALFQSDEAEHADLTACMQALGYARRAGG